MTDVLKDLVETFLSPLDRALHDYSQACITYAHRNRTDDDNEEIFQLAELMRHHGRIVDLVDEMIKEAREAGKTEGQNEQRRDQGSV